MIHNIVHNANQIIYPIMENAIYAMKINVITVQMMKYADSVRIPSI
jgi:hypothetical protein